MNLSADLYKRFGLEFELEKVQSGFCIYVKNSLLNDLAPLTFPNRYEEKDELDSIQGSVVREACRQMFIDYGDFDYSLGFGDFVKFVFYEEELNWVKSHLSH